jgi:hypothetical protein
MTDVLAPKMVEELDRSMPERRYGEEIAESADGMTVWG